MLTIETIPPAWRKPMVFLLAVLSVFVLMFQGSWQSIVNIWSRSDTFAHGYLVAPVALWLLWTRRDFYRQLQPRPSYLGFLGVLMCGFIWLVADLAHVLVVGQFALVGMLVCLIWTVLGNQVTGNMLYPLLFLFLMVPFGEDFVPFLMEYTASFVVAMLRLTGITVYREGLHFSLISGNWSVVDACSGIRYLIASITLGLVYAYLNYSNYFKRSVFILAAVLVPIVANGFRAYMIVMIGHLSNMKLATGVDHIIYGWVFFGVVMLLLFYIGSFWHDRSFNPADQALPENSDPQPGMARFVSVSAILLLCVGIWPLAAAELHARQAIKATIPAGLVKNLPLPADAVPDWRWQPQFKGSMIETRLFVMQDDATVGVYMANFGDESQGEELVNSQNALLSKDDEGWRELKNPGVEINWPVALGKVQESVLTNESEHLLVMRWYRIGNINTANAYYAKWLQLRKRLSGDAAPELMLVLYTETPRADYVQARERLRKIALACCSGS